MLKKKKKVETTHAFNVKTIKLLEKSAKFQCFSVTKVNTAFKNEKYFENIVI